MRIRKAAATGTQELADIVGFDAGIQFEKKNWKFGLC